jgi:hypothetical protein
MKVGFDEVGSGKIGSAEVSLVEVGSGEFGPGEIGPTKVVSSKTGPPKIWSEVPILVLPFIPRLDPLLEDLEMLRVRHRSRLLSAPSLQ